MKSRILVIDDSDDVRAVLRAQLGARNYTVVEAAGADEGLRLARETQPDVILLDIEMPGRDGFSALEEIREDEELRQIPVIFLTGRIDPDHVARGLRSGAHDYLRKPAEPVELTARLNSALRTKQLQDALRERNEQLQAAACTDSLTHLYNRRYADEELISLVSRSRRHARELSLALFDLDAFRAVNDSHGHEAGDAVLVELSHRLVARKRAEDVLGRWGGDQFILLMPDTDLEGGMLAAEGFRAAVGESPVRVREREIGMTMSAGVSALSGDERPEDMVRRADRALNEAKQGGRNQVRECV